LAILILIELEDLRKQEEEHKKKASTQNALPPSGSLPKNLPNKTGIQPSQKPTQDIKQQNTSLGQESDEEQKGPQTKFEKPTVDLVNMPPADGNNALLELIENRDKILHEKE
jgi:hypothetical protein